MLPATGPARASAATPTAGVTDQPRRDRSGTGHLTCFAEPGGERRHRRIEFHSGRQCVRVGPVEVAEADAVIGDLRVVPGGLELARGLLQCRAVAQFVDRSSPVPSPSEAI